MTSRGPATSLIKISPYIGDGRLRQGPDDERLAASEFGGRERQSAQVPAQEVQGGDRRGRGEVRAGAARAGARPRQDLQDQLLPRRGQQARHLQDRSRHGRDHDREARTPRHEQLYWRLYRADRTGQRRDLQRQGARQHHREGRQQQRARLCTRSLRLEHTGAIAHWFVGFFIFALNIGNCQ